MIYLRFICSNEVFREVTFPFFFIDYEIRFWNILFKVSDTSVGLLVIGVTAATFVTRIFRVKT